MNDGTSLSDNQITSLTSHPLLASFPFLAISHPHITLLLPPPSPSLSLIGGVWTGVCLDSPRKPCTPMYPPNNTSHSPTQTRARTRARTSTRIRARTIHCCALYKMWLMIHPFKLILIVCDKAPSTPLRVLITPTRPRKRANRAILPTLPLPMLLPLAL